MIALYEILVNVATPAAGAAFDCGRNALVDVLIVDAEGEEIPATAYSATAEELLAGVLHWADPLSTAGHPTPWRVAAFPGQVLPKGLLWTNRFDWQGGLSQVVSPTFGRIPVLESFQMLTGRDIKLAPPSPDVGTLSYAEFVALEAWSAVAGKRFLLAVDSTFYHVQFARPAFDNPRAALGFSNYKDGERWLAGFNFVTV